MIQPTPRNSLEGYYRFTDILFEWHKELNPHAASAIKTLLATNALAHPLHPLRSKGKDGVEVYLGSFADGKVRALFSFKQVAYLRYHVREVGLINAIVREQAGLRDAEEDMRPGTWDEIRLPSGKHLLYEDQMIQLSPLTITSAEMVKLVKRDAKKALKLALAGRIDAEPGTPPVCEVPAPASKTATEAPASLALSVPVTVKDSKGIEVGPAVRRDPGPTTTYYHAGQAYIIASTGGRSPAYLQGHAASGAHDRVAGRGLFLCVDFACEGAHVRDLGYAASWWEGGEEVVDQGHWIVEERQSSGDASSKEDGAIHGVQPAQIPYISDRPSETLPLVEFERRVAVLIPDMQAKLQPNGGPIYLVVYSAEKPLAMLRLLGLPVDTYHTSLHPQHFVAEAYASTSAIGEVFVIDASEMVAALEEPAENLKPSTMRLEQACRRVFHECEEPVVGFGHSGNSAFLALQLLLCLAAQPLELARNNFTLAERYDEMVAARLTRALDTNSETPAQWDDAIADADAGSDASSVGTGAWAVHIGPGGPEEGLSDDD